VGPVVQVAVSTIQALNTAETLDSRHAGAQRWQALDVAGARRQILAPFATLALGAVLALDSCHALASTNRHTVARRFILAPLAMQALDAMQVLDSRHGGAGRRAAAGYHKAAEHRR
jgi:hypothetical protein